MDVVEDVLSDPVSGGIHFTATANGGGIFGFFNDTGHLITALTIQTQAAPGLQPEDIRFFTCNAPNAYFLNCSVDYDYNPDINSAFGLLTINFFGVNPPNDDSQIGEAGDQEGIGQVPSRIILCDGICPAVFDPNLGHFAINLNDGGLRTGDIGGWNQEGLFPNGPASFDGFATLAGVPEPGTLLLFASSLAGAVAVRRRRR
jgi:hypothetical protein